MKLYEFAADRARLLYRIPPVPREGRTLELYHSELPLHSKRDSSARPLTLCRIGPHHSGRNLISENDSQSDAQAECHAPLPFPQSSFDLVIVHRTLDELAASQSGSQRRFEPSTLLSHIQAVLAPGGVVAGCVSNRWALKTLVAKFRPLAAQTHGPRLPGRYSLGSIHRFLATAGLSDAQVFTLLPNGASPSKLIDTDSTISRIAFRHELNIARHRRASLGYFARLAMVELGMNRHLEEAYFFWAFKPC